MNDRIEGWSDTLALLSFLWARSQQTGGTDATSTMYITTQITSYQDDKALSEGLGAWPLGSNNCIFFLFVASIIILKTKNLIGWPTQLYLTLQERLPSPPQDARTHARTHTHTQ